MAIAVTAGQIGVAANDLAEDNLSGDPQHLRAFVRRTIAYNREPRRLILLPISIATVILGLYGLASGDPSVTLMWIVVGLVTFVTVVDAASCLITSVRRSQRTTAPRIK